MEYNKQFCQAHSAHSQRLTCVEGKCNKLDSRLWYIVILLISNLAGIIGILVSVNLH